MKLTLEELRKFPLMQKFKCVLSEYPSEQLKFAREDEDTVFVFSKGSKTRGWRKSNDIFLKYYEADSYETVKEKENKKFYADLKKASDKLQKSGLWGDFKVVLDNLLNVSPEDKDSIYAIWRDGLKPDRTPSEAYKPFVEKYPFLFNKDKDGVYQLNYEYVDLISRKELGLKSMYFGTFNKDEKIEIKCAIADKRPYSTRAYTSYDVTFSYDAAKAKAWYSEEYRGCGNGHYYIALDENTALFIEND